jgi:hypothetical protein
MTEFKRNSLTSAVSYRDPASAWTGSGLRVRAVVVITDKEGNIGHAEMRFREPDHGRGGGPDPRVRPRSARTPSQCTFSSKGHRRALPPARRARNQWAGGSVLRGSHLSRATRRSYLDVRPDGEKSDPDEWDRASGLDECTSERGVSGSHTDGARRPYRRRAVEPSGNGPGGGARRALGLLSGDGKSRR